MTKTEVDIEGMHCGSCEVLLERRVKKIPGVTKVTVSHAKGKAIIHSDHSIKQKDLEGAINKGDYRISAKASAKPRTHDYVEIGALFIIFIAVYSLLQYFDIIPSIGVSEGMSLGFVFVIGLIAATSTCLAVTGGLLLTLSAKYSELNPTLSGARKFKPTLYFNAGRIMGYTVFGAVLGAVGSLFTFSPTASGVLTILAAAIMIILGLQMLHIFPFLNDLSFKPPKFIAHKIHDSSSGAYKAWAPFALGASTFFLPCGFTQALQFYVLAQGSPITGALTMLVFALGTLPVLLALGAVSSFTRGSAHKQFIRGAAVLVILLGLYSLPAGIALVRMAFG